MTEAANRIQELEAALAQKTRECEELRAATESFRSLLTLRLDNHLCEMKPEHDDSIVGFNEAQDIVRKAFQEAWSVPNPIWEATRAQVEQLERQVAELSKPVTEEEWAKYHGWIVNMLEDDDDREPFQYACMNRQELDKFIAARAALLKSEDVTLALREE